jgi:hypothetical protein
MKTDQLSTVAVHPLVGRQYAGTPGKGPAGKTCKRCQHITHGGIGRAEHANPQCILVPIAERRKLWTGKPACEHWEPISGLADTPPNVSSTAEKPSAATMGYVSSLIAEIQKQLDSV